jgi:hypothetical protein
MLSLAKPHSAPLRVVSDAPSASLKIYGRLAEINVSAPIARVASLDEPAGFHSDAISACAAHVPRLEGFAEDFRAELRGLDGRQRHGRPEFAAAPEMLRIYDFTVEHLLFGKFDGSNPGSVFVAAQCFGGLWAGVAAQAFAIVLVRRCTAAVAGSEAHRQRGMQPLDLAIAVLSSMAKCFGCSMRIAPIVPRWPDDAGSPPDPVVLLADALVARFRAELPFADRADLIEGLRAWHVPRSIHDAMPDWKRVWHPQRQYDRARSMMRMQLMSPTSV